MNIKLMKLELKNLSLYSNNALEIDFFAEKRVYESRGRVTQTHANRRT